MIKRLVLFALIFSLPFQLGYHFWLPESFVKSFRIDYLSPTLYFVDLLILCYIISNLRFIKLNPLLLVLAVVNLWVTGWNPITFFAWLRLFEYFLLFQALRSETNLISKVKRPFLISLCLIIGLAVIQFIRQSSFGDAFYFLGERPLSIALPNVAKTNLPWGQILRPYATFSHPNSFAGYLLVSLVILSLIYGNRKIAKVYLGLAILLTFSKAALLSFAVIEILKISFLQSLILSVALSVAPFLKDLIDLPVWLVQSFSTRHFLLLPAFKMIISEFLLGVGLKQFIPNLSAYLTASQISYGTLQPVHNTFILIFAELGLLGVLILTNVFWTPLSNLAKNIKTRPYILNLFGIILLTGSLDHYWWTLPQNQLIIVLTLALIINRQKEKRHALS